MRLNKSLSLKPYLVSGILMVVFAAAAMYLPDVSKMKDQSQIYFGAPISEASVQQEFFNDPNFNIRQLHGVKIINPDTGRFTYYFEYIANKQDTLRRISAMPFIKDNRVSSLGCELMNAESNPLDHAQLTQEEQEATAFFWEANAEEFTFYECFKSPMKHTVLISKTSDRILHKVESV